MRVLVIEDDAILTEALEIVLGEHGHEVTVVRDGLLGWQELHDADALPDLILLDLWMPRLDGRELRQRQLADPRLASIPTLVFTAAPVDPPTRASLGRVPVVPKPIEADRLLAAIDEITAPIHSVKQCTCCGRSYTPEEWRRLSWVGEVDNGRDLGERLELRWCECKTTLAWEVGRHAVSIPVPVTGRPSGG